MPLLKTPWYFGWNIVAVTLVFQAVLFGSIFFSYTLWVGEWRDDASLGASLTMLMVPLTILNLAQSFIAPFAGHAMDRYSIRGLVCTGGIFAGLGFAAISQVTAFWQVTVIYGSMLTVGVLLAGPLAAQTLAAKWFNARRGLAIGITTVGTSLGGMVMAPLVTLLYQAEGWRLAHLVLGGVFVVVIVPLVWLVVRNSPEDWGVEPEPAPKAHAHGGGHIFPAWTTTKILRERTFWVMILAFTPLVTVFGSIQQNLQPYAADLGIGKLDTAFLVSVFAGVMILGKLFFGGMADRFDHRYLFWLAGLTLAVTVGLMKTDPSYELMVLIASLLGFAAGGFLPLLGAIVASRFGPAAFGSVMGLIGPFLAINAFGPMAASALRESQGNYDLFLTLSLALMVPAVLAMAFLRPPPGIEARQRAAAEAPAAGE